MVYRYGWVAGVAGAAFAFWRLQDLVQSSAEGAPWQFVVVAGAILGAIITWTALAYRLNAAFVLVVNLAALLFTSTRIAVPDTTAFLLPTFESFRALRTELSYAFDVIRSGVAPVIPASGLVVIITAVFWGIGALMVWGLQRGRPYVALIPPLLFYLQLATADRGSYAGTTWMLALIVLIAGSLAAVTFDERATTSGRLSRTRAAAAGGVVSSTSMITLVAALVVTLVASSAFAGAVPATGVLPWRQSSGLTGDYFGGISYNPFVSIQKSLVSQRDIEVFRARISGDEADPRRLYWRMLTLDTFNGTWWYAANPRVDRLEEAGFEPGDAAFAGPTEDVTQDVTIVQLRNDWLPAAYSPVAVETDNADVAKGLRIGQDGSVRFGSGSFRGMTYRVRSEVPAPDVSVLATGLDGIPTTAFAAAAEQGLLLSPAESRPEPRELPPDADKYTLLPDSVDERIGTLAEEITFGLESNYERGLALEAYFHNPQKGFRYSTTVPPGEAEGDLAAWLLDSSDPSYFRTGYCEQYATAMGVMARLLGIPTRVVIGFTPGQVFADGTIVVRDTNAHAWVELWLADQGWVRFDPTPRSDGVNPTTLGALNEELGFDIRPFLEIERPEAPDIETGPLPLPQIAEDLPERFVGGSGGADDERPVRLPGWMGNVILLAVVALVTLGGVPVIKLIRRRRRMRRLRRGDISAAWAEITSRLTDLGEPVDPADTPLEYAARTDAALEPLATVYSESIYGPPGNGSSPADVAVANEAISTTESNVALRFSSQQRMLAWYRLRTVIPERLSRAGRKRRKQESESTPA